MDVNNPQRQVYATVAGFSVMAVAIIIAFALTVQNRNDTSKAKSVAGVGLTSCEYQRLAYPSANMFRREVKAFMLEDAARLRRESRLFAQAAREQTDRNVANGAIALSKEKAEEAAKKEARARKITFGPRPTCSLSP